MSPADKTATRTTYHHGDLRNALIESAVELARAEGPDAVVLREVSRRVGVTAAAAYRHFGTLVDLLEEVKNRALESLAEHIVAERAKVPSEGDPQELAIGRFRACAAGYLAFALEEPGLFNTAFCHTSELHESEATPQEQFRQTAAYSMLGSLLDDLVTVGLMPPERRPGAEMAAWSTVHGLAMLLLEGPLRHLSDDDREVGVERTLAMVIDGLTRPADC